MTQRKKAKPKAASHIKISGSGIGDAPRPSVADRERARRLGIIRAAWIRTQRGETAAMQRRLEEVDG